jgi:hypothetical protein
MTYIPNEKISITSAIGVNSDNSTSGGNWVTNTYTGAGEENDYAYVGVNLQVDESGTLYFDFSQDGSNWSSYPVAGFTVVSGINEVHTAWKGGRFMRPRFVGTGGRTYFRLKTFYSNTPLPLSAPLNQGIGSDQDAQVVRAVGIGENPNGTYVNTPSGGVVDSNSSTDTLGIAGVFTGAWESLEGLAGITVLVDGTSASTAPGTLEMQFSHDTVTIHRNISVTVDDIANAAPRTLGSVAKYFRIVYTNGGVAHTSTNIQTMFHKEQVQLVGRLNSGLAGNEDASLVRAVNAGQKPDSSFANTRQTGTAFKTTANLNAGQTFDSGVLDIKDYQQVQTQIVCDQNGTLKFIFGSSSDMSGSTVGTNGVNRVISLPYESEKGFESFSAPAFTDYVRYEFTNNSASTTTHLLFDTKLLTTALSGQVLTTVAPIAEGMVANLGRNILVGETDGKEFLNVPVDTKGHLEVAVHGPLNPFGSIHTEKMTPIFQTDAVYGLNDGQVFTTSTLSGSAGSVDSKFIVSSGTNAFSSASIQSRRRLRYRPGQGVIGRYTSKFTTPVPFSYQIAGFGHAEDGVYFGYKDLAGSIPEFGILYVNRGVREIQTLTITTASSTTENITITLNGVAFSVPVTNSANIQRTVWEISQFDYSGWEAFPKDDTIVFVSSDAGNKASAFTLSNATTAVGTFVETKAGVTGTEQFIPQSQWNGDKLDGSGGINNPSGVTLDPTKGNVFQIGIQYLGFGAITFDVEVVEGGNNATWVNVHTLDSPNNLTTTTFSNPSFPFTMAIYSAGSTTNLEVESGSFSGFVEGDVIARGNRFVYEGKAQALVGTTNYRALGTILNKRVYNGKASQVVINIKEFAAHIEDNASGGSMYLIRNGELVGNPNFVDYSVTSATSYDTSATEVTFTDNNQVVATIPLGINGAEDHELKDTITIQPGEWITLAARSDTAVLDFCTIAVTTREDQ